MSLLEIQFVNTEEKKDITDIITNTLKECYCMEGLNEKIYTNIIITDNKTIKEYNTKYRGIEKETDVLSFPMFEKVELQEIIKKDDSSSIVQEEVLGDIIISIPKIEEQSKEYGHSFLRELSYMVVHGFYHLMGYDHANKQEEEEMRKKEEEILIKLKVVR